LYKSFVFLLGNCLVDFFFNFQLIYTIFQELNLLIVLWFIFERKKINITKMLILTTTQKNLINSYCFRNNFCSVFFLNLKTSRLKWSFLSHYIILLILMICFYCLKDSSHQLFQLPDVVDVFLPSLMASLTDKFIQLMLSRQINILTGT
jgi:hypothetical protein